MKKFLLLASSLVLLNVVPIFAEDNEAQIKEIESQIEKLQEDLKKLKGDNQKDETNEVIIEDEKFIIKFLGTKVKDDSSRPKLMFNFEVENNTEFEYVFQSQSVSIDDYMVDSKNYSMSDEIAPNKKGKITLTIYDKDEEGLPELNGNLDFTLKAFDWDHVAERMEYVVSIPLE